MEKLTKRKAYLPVKTEDELPELQINDIKDNVFAFDGDYKFVAETIKINGRLQDLQDCPNYATHWLKEQEVYFFTPEELNEYTANVIQKTLETAAKEAHTKFVFFTDDVEVDQNSILETFDETYKRFKQ